MTRMHGSGCSGNPCIRGLIRVGLVRREDEARYGDAAQPDQAVGVGVL
jgi:hypothetical protein